MSEAQPRSSLTENLRFFLNPYRSRIAGLILLQIAAALLTAVSVGAISPVVSNVLGIAAPVSQGEVMASITRLADFLPFRDHVISAMAFVLLTVILAETASYAAGLASTRLRSIALRDWTLRGYEKILSADYQYFLDTKQGDIVHLVMVAAYNTQTLFEMTTVVGASLQVIALLGLLLSISAGLTLLAAAVAALAYGGLSHLSRRAMVRLGEECRETSARQFAVADESIRGVRVLKVFGVTEHWKQAFRESTAAYTRASVIHEAVRFAPGAAASVGLAGMLGAGALWARHTLAGGLHPHLPTLAIFIYALRQMTSLLPPASAAALGTIGALPYAQTLRNALEAPRAAIPNGSKTFHGLEGCIAFEHATYAHKDRAKTLLDVSFTVERNQITAIVGPSGAGKSTVVDLLLRLYDAQDGAIRIDGTDLREFAIETWRRAIGVVSQDLFVFHATIAENIAFGKPDATMDEIQQAARLADAHDFIMECENGYATLVGDQGMKLSGGQRQRLVLARALIKNPQVLILDEATSSIDTRSEASIQEALWRLKDRCTQIVVAHRLSSVQHADKIVVLREGHVAEVGTHQTLLQRRGLYYGLYRNQTRHSQHAGLRRPVRPHVIDQSPNPSGIHDDAGHSDSVPVSER